MRRRKTAGELSLKARNDNTKYDPLEVGHALTDDVVKQLYICAERHLSIFDEDEFCLGLFVAGDPLIQGVRRHKYAAFLYLPSPRPEQSCYLYNKKNNSIKRLWSLPNAKVMAVISEMKQVAPKWKLTKEWCDAFFDGKFWEHIRRQHNISLLSEHEYLNVHREELIKSGGQESSALDPQPFDFSKIKIDKIIDTKTAIGDQ